MNEIQRNTTTDIVKPGHEYTKANVKFAASVSQRDAVQKLHSFAENNKITTGKFTIGDEKACGQSLVS